MSTRRRLLRAALGSVTGAALAPWATLSVAAGTNQSANRFVFIILRGGLDGLTAAPAIGDPAFADARGALGVFATEPLRLDATFALNPLLPHLHAMYGRGEMAVLHAVGLPYRERSHFDAQQLLESGGTRPYELATGWLGRALTSSGGTGSTLRASAMAALRPPPPAPPAPPEPPAGMPCTLAAMPGSARRPRARVSAWASAGSLR